MKIRTAHFTDCEAIARVHVSSWRTTYQDIISADFLAGLSVERRRKSWEWTFKNLRQDEVIYAALDDNGEIIGFANGGKNLSDEYEYEAELYCLYLLDSYQGKGIGRALFEAVVNSLREKQYSSFMVWVLEKNPTIHFYEHFGGKVFTTKNITIGEEEHVEAALGWKDISSLRNLTLQKLFTENIIKTRYL